MKEFFQKIDSADLLTAEQAIDEAFDAVIQEPTKENKESWMKCLDRLIEVKVRIALRQHTEVYHNV